MKLSIRVTVSGQGVKFKCRKKRHEKICATTKAAEMHYFTAGLSDMEIVYI